jgi:hypothetical protein
MDDRLQMVKSETLQNAGEALQHAVNTLSSDGVMTGVRQVELLDSLHHIVDYVYDTGTVVADQGTAFPRLGNSLDAALRAIIVETARLLLASRTAAR